MASISNANHSSPCSHGDSDPQAASKSINAKPNSDADQLLGPPPSSVSRSEALAKVIFSSIGSVIRDFDSKAEEASRSQDQLSLLPLIILGKFSFAAPTSPTLLFCNCWFCGIVDLLSLRLHIK
ncbi:hypothetical protein Dimus_011365 [Dionaea muscipula]